VNDSIWRRAAGATGRAPLILGHRGARRVKPENSLAAFEQAIREGADGVEIDVRLDRSGNVIVLHDATLERVTDGRDRRRADDVESPELRHIDIGQDERIPQLVDVLGWSNTNGALVNVEIKHDVRRPLWLVKRVAELVRQAPHRDRILISCFHPGIVALLGRTLGAVPVAWLVHAGQHLVRRAPGWRLLGASGVHPERRLVDSAYVARVHGGGGFINVWTVNEVDEARRLVELGVDALISDVPGELVAALR
jgi:glycerophosphoryl diester phosphodiesterase